MANNLVNGDTFEFVSGATEADFNAQKMSASRSAVVVPLLVDGWTEYAQGTYDDNKIFVEVALDAPIKLSNYSILRFEWDFAGLIAANTVKILNTTVSDGVNRLECYPVTRDSGLQSSREYKQVVYEMPVYSGGLKDGIGAYTYSYTKTTFTNGSVFAIDEITKVGICLLGMDVDTKYIGGVTVKITPIK